MSLRHPCWVAEFFIDYRLFFIDYILLFIDSRSLFINYLFILYLLLYIFSSVHGNRGLGVEDRHSNPEELSLIPPGAFFLFS
jgi:hypothetical protein